MTTEVKVPELPESVSEATVGQWQKQSGDAVERDENLADLETDKVVLEVPAIEDGVLSEIRAASGETVHAGDVLAIIDAGASGSGDGQSEQSTDQTGSAQDSDDQSQSEQAAETATRGGVASPAARKIMDEAEVESEDVAGSGKAGRVTKGDATQAASSHNQPAAGPSANTTSTGADTANNASAEQSTLADDGVAERREQRVPMTRIRQRISERLLDASQNTAMLTTFNELDMQAVMSIRSRYKEKFQTENDVKLGFMSFFVTAAVEALKRYPVVNASIDAGDIVYHGYYDVGLAVSSPRGLLVPVLRDADTLSFAQIENGVQDFGQRAQSGKIDIDELTGGTFTITNGGIFGSYCSTPIVNPPQAAILGMHATKDRPVVVDGEIQIRPIMMLALSYDHRLIDGRDAVLFLRSIKEQLEDPTRLLLQI